VQVTVPRATSAASRWRAAAPQAQLCPRASRQVCAFSGASMPARRMRSAPACSVSPSTTCMAPSVAGVLAGAGNGAKMRPP
jgi:hypothetical protein